MSAMSSVALSASAWPGPQAMSKAQHHHITRRAVLLIDDPAELGLSTLEQRLNDGREVDNSEANFLAFFYLTGLSIIF
jgi:hypothetical protein